MRARWRGLEDEAIAQGRLYEMSPATQTLGNILAPLIAEHAHGRVLDAGAGRLALRHVILRSAQVTEYVSIDCATTDPRLGAVADLLDGLPFVAETFDCVLCSQVLEHVPEPQRALTEIARVLKTRGTLLLSVPHLCFVHGAPYDFFRYTPFGVEYLLRQAGLEPVSIRPAGGLLSLLLTPASMGVLLAGGTYATANPASRLATALNRGILEGVRWLETRFDHDKVFALNVVALAQKPPLGVS
jgi:SAM-dependent methyltransferase